MNCMQIRENGFVCYYVVIMSFTLLSEIKNFLKKKKRT